MKYIKGFDSIRGISIFMVLGTHLGLYNYLPENHFIKERAWFLFSGSTGVLIFFTLSGFLITKILLLELAKHKVIKFKLFYIRRFIRLLPPLVLFYSIIYGLMYFEIIKQNIIGLLFSITYIYNFIPNKYYSGELGHTWSLAVEEQYYFFWPIIINYFSKKRIFYIIIIVIVTSLICLYLFPTITYLKHFKYHRWLIPAVSPIVIGSIFAILVNDGIVYKNRFEENYLYLFLSFICFVYPLYSTVLELSFIFQSMGVSIFLIWVLFNQESKLTSLLSNKFLSYIGLISYGVYVYQGIFLKTGPNNSLWFQLFPQNIIFTFLLAILSYHYIEKPIMKLKNRFR